MGIRVLIKGMNKVVSFPAETKMEVIETSIKGNWANVEKMSGLPMDTASRMERAKYLGFDPETSFRGLSQPFDESKSGHLTWTTKDPEYASAYSYGGADKLDIGKGSNVLPINVKSENPFDFGFRSQFTEVKYDDMLDRLQRGVTDSFKNGKIGREEGLDLLDEIIDMRDAAPDANAFKPVFSWWNDKPEMVEILKKSGYDSMNAVEGIGDNIPTSAVFDKSQIRSKFAEFNPANKESGNLLASAAPATVGAGLLAGGSNKAEASTGERMIPDEVALDFYKEMQGSNIGTMELDDFMGALDVVASLGSGLVGMSVGGIAGILTGGDVGAIDAVSKGFQRDLVTDAGKESLAKLTKLLGPVESVHKFLVDISGEKAGKFAKKADPRLVAPVTEGVRALVDLVSPI